MVGDGEVFVRWWIWVKWGGGGSNKFGGEYKTSGSSNKLRWPCVQIIPQAATDPAPTAA